MSIETVSVGQGLRRAGRVARLALEVVERGVRPGAITAVLLALWAAAPALAQQPAGGATGSTAPDTLARHPHGRRLAAPAPTARGFVEVRRFAAPEARQGVAVDARHFYAIGNAHIAKYERSTGRRVAEWRGEPDGPIVHLNSCTVQETRLVCAHSNYPGLPMLSSIETWDAATLRHLESRSLGIYEGSLTWVVRHAGGWWLNFAHYGGASGTPGRGPEWTSLVRFDDGWNRIAAYAYPVRLVERLAPYSSSGGGWGPDGRLYVTGHDEPEVYVLRLPGMGSVLEWEETLPAPIEGQAWVFDPADPATLWGISRRSGAVVVAKLQP